MRALPEGVELVADVSVAQWVVDGLQPWGRDRIRVASIVPQGFEAYARVPHAGQVEFGDGIPHHQLMALIPPLSMFTSTPDSCWICIWSGYGFWSSRAFALMILGDPDGGDESEIQRIEAEFQRVMTEREQLMDGVAQVETEGREYFMFHGPISAAGSMAFDFDGSPESPNLWWPDDKAWCVASDIDLPTTFVGGSRQCIDELLATSGLDASEVAPDDDVNERPAAGR